MKEQLKFDWYREECETIKNDDKNYDEINNSLEEEKNVKLLFEDTLSLIDKAIAKEN